MCLFCGKNEVGATYGSDRFCSSVCERDAYMANSTTTEDKEWRDFNPWANDEMQALDGNGKYDDFLSQYDNDPSPYDGNYSEE